MVAVVHNFTAKSICPYFPVASYLIFNRIFPSVAFAKTMSHSPELIVSGIVGMSTQILSSKSTTLKEFRKKYQTQYLNIMLESTNISNFIFCHNYEHLPYY